MLHRLVLVVPLVGWLACSLGFDGDDLQTGSSATSSVASTGGRAEAGANPGGAGGEAPCTCLDVPRGWAGPVVLREAGDGDAECGRGESIIAEGGLGPSSAPPAECDCTCGAPNDPCKLTLFVYDDTACNDYLIDFPGTAACNDEPIGTVGSISATGTFSGTSSCPASSTQPTLPPVQWAKRAALCSFGQEEACEPGQVCRGSSTELERVCIFQRGTVECPPEFDEPLSFTEVESDTRSCSLCTCGPVGGTQCAVGTVSYYNSDNCIGQLIGTDNLGGCFQPMMGTIESAQITPAIPGSCQAIGGDPSGDVTFAERTYCCMPVN